MQKKLYSVLYEVSKFLKNVTFLNLLKHILYLLSLLGGEKC